MTIKLKDIYENLGPSSISNPTNTIQKDIFQILADSLYDENGKPATFKQIKGNIDSHFIGEKEAQKILAQHFHGIGDSQINIYTDKAENYWQKIGDNALSIIGSVPHKDSLPKISVFPIRGPRITPSKRGTQKISFFLNYTPAIVAAQMVPFLDVKFITAGTDNKNISTPGIIRFLLGSGQIEGMTGADKLMGLGDYSETAGTRSGTPPTGSSGFGMEMFLMPQTLTNMDALKPSSTGITRLMNVKPFVPFASIEGFDVSIQNAGAGAFAHKTGTLKLKIHDKSRISEISEFIKGADGFSRVSISTTYGWSAPKNRGVEDEYSTFINTNMQVTDKWTVMNSQFSFDASGQVAINLQLVSKSAMVLQAASMAGAESGIEKFYSAIKIIDAGKGKITGRKNYSADALTEKIFNAASGDAGLVGMTPQQLKTAAEKLKNLASRSMDGAELTAFTEAVTLVTDNNAFATVKNNIISIVNDKFKDMANGADPFMPSGKLSCYFDGEFVKQAHIIKQHADYATKKNGKGKAVVTPKRAPAGAAVPPNPAAAPIGVLAPPPEANSSSASSAQEPNMSS